MAFQCSVRIYYVSDPRQQINIVDIIKLHLGQVQQNLGQYLILSDGEVIKLTDVFIDKNQSVLSKFLKNIKVK